MTSFRHPIVPLLSLIGALFLLAGCVSTKYKMASKQTPPPVGLDRPFPAQAPLAASLRTLIIYKGPGSWKRQAYWDEYVLTLKNAGDQPLTIDSGRLIDPAGVAQDGGTDPWKLEKESKTLEQKYRDAGIAFAKNAAPLVLVTAVGYGAAAGSIMAAGGAGGAVALANAMVIALPIYYGTVLVINRHNKQAIMAEFARRRLALPLTLAPGESRTGSLFFPMIPEPSRLDLAVRSEGATTTSSLPLDFLKGLHVSRPEKRR